jgi:hypothetical protein
MLASIGSITRIHLELNLERVIKEYELVQLPPRHFGHQGLGKRHEPLAHVIAQYDGHVFHAAMVARDIFQLEMLEIQCNCIFAK